MLSMKSINYRGGIARFNLPSSWAEEYDQEGGAAFYEDKPDSGTLRINVMNIEKPPGKVGPADTIDNVIGQISGTGSVHRLPSGVVIAQTNRLENEDGNELSIENWYLGVTIASNHFRIIIFTYTILAAQKSDANVQQEIAMLNRSISEGDYPAVRGVSGNYVQ
jgi:hypothetical protein